MRCLLSSLMLTLQGPLLQTWHVPAKQTSVATSLCMCPLYMQLRLGREKTVKVKYLSNTSQAPEPLDLSLLTVDSKTKTNGAAPDWPPWLHPCNRSSLHHSSGHASDKDPRPGERHGGGAFLLCSQASPVLELHSPAQVRRGMLPSALNTLPTYRKRFILHKTHQGFLMRT